MESEIKLLAPPAQLVKLLKMPLIEAVTVGAPVTQKLTTVYFDTPELTLRDAGISLRVRQIGKDRRVQTLKANGRINSGLHQRDEWETEVDGDVPDLAVLRSVIDDKDLQAQIVGKPTVSERLQPVFTVNARRLLRLLRLPTGDEIEMVIDRGTIASGGAKEAISEIELELKSGDAAHLYAFADQVVTACPMCIGTLSKSDRGYALHRPGSQDAVKAATLTLRPVMGVEEAFAAIVGNCLEQIARNMHGVIDGTHPEHVHQMRVGVRRLRSALDLFDEAIACPATLKAEWKWLAAELGAARDWEVLSHSTLEPFLRAGTETIDMRPVQEVAIERARKCREQAAIAVRSARHTRLQLQFGEWVSALGWRGASTQDAAALLQMPLKNFAKRVLERAESRLLKRGARLKDNEPESRHRARIAGKKVRYATEFFMGLFPKKRVRPYVSSLSGLQEALGALNDAAVATGLLDRLSASDPKVAVPSAFARGYLTAALDDRSPHLKALWKAYKTTRPPH